MRNLLTAENVRFFVINFIAFSIGYILLFLFSLFYIFRSPWITLFITIFTAVLMVRFVFAIFRHRINRLISCAILFLFSGFLFFYNDTILDTGRYFTTRVKISLFPARYDACVKAAADIGYGAMFNVCEEHDLWEIQDLIIYDTREHKAGDPFAAVTSRNPNEINEKNYDRKTLQALAVMQMFGNQIPLESANLVHMEKIEGSFYRLVYRYYEY